MPVDPLTPEEEAALRLEVREGLGLSEHLVTRLLATIDALRDSGEPSVFEAATIKGCHPHTIRKAIKDGDLVARQFGRAYAIRRDSLARWEPRGVGRPKEDSNG